MKNISKISLGFFPTPIEYANNLTELLNGPEIYIKRDDLSGLALGGNKVRKLEYLLADLKNRGVDTVITTDHVQSNWSCLTSACARKLNMRVILILKTNPSEPIPTKYDGNLLLNYMLGSDIRIVKNEEKMKLILEEVFNECKKKNYNAELIDITSAEGPLSAVGYFDAAKEITEQMKDKLPNYVFVTAALSSTQAGLVTGFKYFNEKIKVVGINCGFKDDVFVKNAVYSVCTDLSKILEINSIVSKDDVIVIDDYAEGGYRKITSRVVDAVKLLSSTESIFIDPVYTGKTLLGLIDMIKNNKISKNDRVVLMHTGGVPNIFAFGDLLSKNKTPNILD